MLFRKYSSALIEPDHPFIETANTIQKREKSNKQKWTRKTEAETDGSKKTGSLDTLQPVRKAGCPWLFSFFLFFFRLGRQRKTVLGRIQGEEKRKRKSRPGTPVEQMVRRTEHGHNKNCSGNTTKELAQTQSSHGLCKGNNLATSLD